MIKIKNTLLLPLIFTALLLFFQGCIKDPVAEISLSPGEAALGNLSGTTEIEVVANGNWTATVSEMWCEISPRSGKGNGTITIKATGNLLSEPRSAVLSVVSNGLARNVAISQDFPKLSIEQDELTFDKTAGARIINISSNTNWSIEVPGNANWITVDKISGTGDAQVTFTVLANTSGPARNTTLHILYGAESYPVKVTQRRSQNNPPLPPSIIYPSQGESDVMTIPGFRWTQSTDPDGDIITYTVLYTKDNVNWNEASTATTELWLNSHLSENTTYSWKIKAEDSEGGVSETPVYSFTTGLKRGYADGEYKIHQQASAGIGGAAAEILLIGDGYTAPDFQEGGTFESDILEGIGYILGVEPVKTYRNHFTIIKQAAYSQERGVTEADQGKIRNSALSSSFNGGSAISVSQDKVLNYARRITGTDEERLRRMLIIVVINQDRYAGTTYIWTDGFAIALIPVSRSSQQGYRYGNVLVHEAIGHGLGGLADEYITEQGKTLPASNRSDAEIWMEHGFFRNIDFTSDPLFIKWKRYLSEPGYSRVGIYEGAYYYSYGAWRSEVSSCMVDNQFYFNAPSREAIVRRILAKSGHTFNIDDFISGDVEKSPPVSAQAFTKSQAEFIPLAPPVLMTK